MITKEEMNENLKTPYEKQTEKNLKDRLINENKKVVETDSNWG